MTCQTQVKLITLMTALLHLRVGPDRYGIFGLGDDTYTTEQENLPLRYIVQFFNVSNISDKDMEWRQEFLHFNKL